MKNTILGARRSSGDYDIDGKQGTYDNVVLFCSCRDSKTEGLSVAVIKLKTAEFGAAIVQAAGASLGNEAHALKPLIGKVVDIDRDDKGHIVAAELVSNVTPVPGK